MIDEKYKHKVHLLPTTDGSMYFRLNDSIRKDRIELYKENLELFGSGHLLALIMLKKFVQV